MTLLESQPGDFFYNITPLGQGLFWLFIVLVIIGLILLFRKY